MKILTIMIGILSIILLASLVNALTITSVSSSPTEIKPGEKVSVYLTIENNLEEDAEDVTVTLDLKDVPFAPYQSSSQVNFKDIKENKDKEARFELIADSDAESGTYKVPVKISYYISGENKSSEGLISLIVNAQPRLDVYVEDSVLIKGRNAELTVKIVNSGLGEARLLSLRLKSALGIKVLSNDNLYIGNIDSDDFDTADFQVSISENAPSIISLPVEISYKDSRNNEIVENKNLEIRTYTEKQAVSLGLIKKSNTTNVIIGIVALIVLFIIYRKWRKARKKRKLERED